MFNKSVGSERKYIKNYEKRFIPAGLQAYARPVLMATSKMQEKLESLEGRIKEIAYAGSKNEKMAEKKTVN